MDPEDELAEELAHEETGGDDPWHEEGWYFDLPAGAWERQEAKNRMLRDNIRANVKRDTSLRALEARRDPFHARDPLLGLAQHADGPAWGEEMDDAPVSQQAGDTWPDPEPFEDEEPGSWKADLPDRQPRTMWQEEEPEPEWGAPEDLERRTGPRRPGTNLTQHEPAAESDDAWNPAPLRPMNSEARMVDDESSEVRSADTADGAPKRSRWDEMFGGPPDTSIIEAMRDWSAGAKPNNQPARDLTELPPELLQPFDWEDDEQAEAGSSEEPIAEAGPQAINESKEPSEPVEAPQDPPLALVEQSALDPGGWDTFAAKIAPALQRVEPDRKPMRFGKLFGRGSDRKDASGDWSVDPAAISEVKNAGGDRQREPAPASADPAALAGWEPMEAGTDDRDPEPAEEGPDGALGATPRGIAGPGPGAWGAPPSDEDGSLKYELPRRFTDRDVWDDEWFERPPSDERVPVRPPHIVRDETPTTEPEPAAPSETAPSASAESIEEDLARAYEEARAFAAPETPPHAIESTALEGHETVELAATAAELPSVQVGVGPSDGADDGLAAKSEESFATEGADAERERGDAEGDPLAAEAGFTSQAEDEVLVMTATRDVDPAPNATDAPQPARSPVDDDPWAAFLVARESDEPLGFRFTSDRDSRLAS